MLGLRRMLDFLPEFSAAAAPAPARLKIPVDSSVAVLGAMARLLYEHHVFDVSNKSLFCRMIAETFTTRRQKEISAGSLKNHFDAPTPEILDMLCAELGKMMKNSRKLWSEN
jgi:hypothetical protein